MSQGQRGGGRFGEGDVPAPELDLDAELAADRPLVDHVAERAAEEQQAGLALALDGRQIGLDHRRPLGRTLQPLPAQQPQGLPRPARDPRLHDQGLHTETVEGGVDIGLGHALDPDGWGNGDAPVRQPAEIALVRVPADDLCRVEDPHARLGPAPAGLHPPGVVAVIAPDDQRQHQRVAGQVRGILDMVRPRYGRRLDAGEGQGRPQALENPRPLAGVGGVGGIGRKDGDAGHDALISRVGRNI